MSAVEAFLVARIAAEAGLAVEAVDTVTAVYRYGMESRALMRIVEEAEAEFGLVADLDRISPAEPIGTLAQALAPP